MTHGTNKLWETMACALLAVAVPMASAQTDRDTDSGAYSTTDSGRTGDRVTLDPGTVIPVRLGTELSSNNSVAGDTFTAAVDTSRSAYNRLMQGATVSGVVRRAKPQSGTDPGTLELAFTRLNLPSGESYPISGTVTSLDQKDLQVRGDGTLQAVKTNKDQSTTYAGIGAGAGLLIGILDGGKVRLGDVLLGGGLGYAAGQLLKGTQQVHDVDLKPGTPVGVLLGQRVLYHRTGLRHTSSSVSAIHTPRSSRALRYYSYQGHPYSLNPVTGKRTRLD